MYSTRTRGTNPYFNNYGSSREQELVESLVIESIKLFGQDMVYLPRQLVSYDELLGEDDQSKFTIALPIELYIKSVDGFTGDGVFLAKFGLEIRDQVTLTMAKRTFEQEITRTIGQVRPNEGDLIYFPLNQKLFQIKYVDYKPFFYIAGELQTYDVTCELFEYSDEIFNTGILEIDEIQSKYSTNALDHSFITQDTLEMLMTEEGDYLVNEAYDTSEYTDPTDDGPEIGEEVEDDEIFDWTETDPYSENGKY